MPQFQFTLTHKATEKDLFDRMDVDADKFITRMVARGHKLGQKDGSGIIGATFLPKGRLEQKDVDTVTAVILDVDGKFRRNGELVYEVIDPEWFLSKLPYRGFAHTSYNHTPAHPKFRVILPLQEAVTPAQFHRLWMWMFEQVEKKCDPSCKNPDRMFFLPRCTNEAADQHWPWLRELRGPFLNLAVVPSSFSPEEKYLPLTPKKKQGVHLAPVEHRRGRVDTHQLLECLLELPVYQWAIENPTIISREVWRGLATNIAAAVLEDENAHDEGRKAFHTVSEGDEERYDSEVTNKTFSDALKSAQSPGPMTYARMIENGAPDDCGGAGHKSPIGEARAKLWQQERTYTKPEAPLVHTSLSTAPALTGGAPLTKAPTPAPAPEGEAPDSFATPDGYVSDDEDEDGGDGKTPVVANTAHQPDEFLFNIETSKWLMKGTRDNWTAEFPGESMTQILITAGVPRKQHDSFKSLVPKFHVRRAVYSSTDPLVYVDGHVIFNTYKPGDVVPLAGPTGTYADFPNYYALFLNLAGQDRLACEYILDWNAGPLQSLRLHGEPFRWNTSCVHVGVPGSGKGTYTTVMGTLYGRSNTTTIGQDALDGRFNEELIDKLFVVANEVMSSSNRSTHTANKIKPWITDAEIPLESKFRKAELVPNNFNIVFTSNDWRPVIVERDDRRYSVFFSGKLDRSVSDAIYADLAGDRKEISAFYDFLLKRKISIRRSELFETESRKQLITASDASDMQFATSIQEEGWLLTAAHWVEQAPTGKIREPTVQDNCVTSDVVYEVYQDFCRQHGMKPFTRHKMGRTLKELPGVSNLERRRIGGLRPTVWTGFPMHAPGTQVIDLQAEKEKREEAEVIPKEPVGEESTPSNDSFDVGVEEPKV